MRVIYSAALVQRARRGRQQPTPAERRLWLNFLRGHPARFRRQVPVMGYILDFYSPSARLCLELDGQTHDGAAARAYDAERTRQLGAAGIRVMRFANADVLGKLDEVCGEIEKALEGQSVVLNRR